MAAINPGNRNNPETAPAVQSPRQGGGGGDSVSSPQSRRAAKAAAAVAPWTQIVRGESEPPIMAAPSSPSSSSTAAVTEQQPVAAASFSSASPSQSNSPSPTPAEDSVGEGSENSSGPNGNAGKKPAWNKPSNGAIEVGPVMGAVSWPALSDARASTKSSSESLKGVSDAPLSVSVTQGAGTTTISSPKQVNSSSTPTHSGPTRQRSMKQRNNASASSNGGIPQHQMPAGQGVEVTPNNPSPKDHSHRSAFGSQTHSSNDHPQQRNSFRNRNGGPHPRGDGSHHHNYGSRHQDRGSQDWNNHRNFNSRDNHMHPQRVVPRAMRPSHQAPAPPNAPAFIPQPMRSFGPIGFDLQGPLVYFQQDPLVPFMAPPRHPLIFAGPDLQLHNKITNQIDYYFSNENLIKDTFLRRNMDDQGWVRVKLIAGFNKVMNLTDNIQIILDALRMSTVVEVQGDKIRRRNDWMRWVMPAAQPPAVSSSQTLGKSGNDMLSAHIQSISLDEKTTNNKNIQNNTQPQPSSGDGAGQFSVQGGADRTISARN
ncbi:la-related protein 1C-like [Rosa rugosa]|uniref:la-related protein 1C-like n=1 Tax=Rosa rugosa TaxID=74645 RepID=UPI002B4045CD|nr:la-related protein 1C-like [Rosa rugosa]